MPGTFLVSSISVSVIYLLVVMATNGFVGRKKEVIEALATVGDISSRIIATNPRENIPSARFPEEACAGALPST